MLCYVCLMTNEIYDKKQLTEYSKNVLIKMYLTQQEALKKQEKQMEDLNKKLDLLLEQIRLSNQNKFGRSTEKIENVDQLTMCFNEAEVTIESQAIEEPVVEQVIPEHKRRKKPKGKRQEDLSSFPVRIEEHLLSDEKLQELFAGSYRRLPDEVYRKLEFHPATFEVVEHHVAVYCGNKEQTIIRADRPSEILKNSIVTPSLLAAVINS